MEGAAVVFQNDKGVLEKQRPDEERYRDSLQAWCGSSVGRAKD